MKDGHVSAMAPEEVVWGCSELLLSRARKKLRSRTGQEGSSEGTVRGVPHARMLTPLLAHGHATRTEGEPAYGWPSHLVKKTYRQDRAGCTGRIRPDAQTGGGRMLTLDADDRLPGELGRHLLSALREKLRGKNSVLSVGLSVTHTHRCHPAFRAQSTRRLSGFLAKGSCHHPRFTPTHILVPLSPQGGIWPLGLSSGVTGLLNND